MSYTKQFIKSIIYLIVWVIFNKFTKLIIIKLKLLGNILYGNFIKTSISKVDENFLFEYPVTLKGGEYIEIGRKFYSRSRLRIEAWDRYVGITYKPSIKIGNNVIINFDCHIGAINSIEIGNNVLIGSRVLITDHNHGESNSESLAIQPSARPLYSKGPVYIQDNVWIGEGVVILPNVTIGKNSIIGANSVVNADIPDNSLAGGIPARVLKRL